MLAGRGGLALGAMFFGFPGFCDYPVLAVGLCPFGSICVEGPSVGDHVGVKDAIFEHCAPFDFFHGML